MSKEQVQRIVRRDPRERVHADVQNPQAFAICDGCGFRVMHNSLRKRMEFRGGNTPEWTGLLVCGRCDDEPQPYYQRQVLPPDPAPLDKPRPDTNPSFLFKLETGGYVLTEEGDFLAQDG